MTARALGPRGAAPAHKRSPDCWRPVAWNSAADGAVQADLARSYGVSEATLASKIGGLPR